MVTDCQSHTRWRSPVIQRQRCFPAARFASSGRVETSLSVNKTQLTIQMLVKSGGVMQFGVSKDEDDKVANNKIYVAAQPFGGKIIKDFISTKLAIQQRT